MWHLTITQRLRLLERRRDELNAWRDAYDVPVKDWAFRAGKIKKIIQVGDAWPVVDASVKDGPVHLEASFEIPLHFAGQPVMLELSVGGEAFVQISNGVSGGLNPYHRSFELSPRAYGGEHLSVVIEAVPKALFGMNNPRPHLERASMVAAHPEVRALVTDLDVLLGAARALGDHEAVPHLLAVAEKALDTLEWPSGSDAYQARLWQGSMGRDAAQYMWNLPEDRPEMRVLEFSVLEQIPGIRERLLVGIQELRARYPNVGRVALSGHAHLDLGWLWPVAETRRKLQRTFATVLGLMERYPEFVFNQSSAQVYAWLEQDDPAMFERVRAHVLEGRIEAIGGMWVEPDAQMLGGESFVRQLLYGQQYFGSRFEQRSTVAWLPDTFGFTPALPQLLQDAGITCFFTTKLNWNETSQFPHDLFWWEGLDGSRVLAHTFKNTFWGGEATGSYNGDFSPESIALTYRDFTGKRLSVWGERGPETLYTFGYGDGGGGPSAEMLETFDRLRNYPALPALEMSRVDELMARLPRDGLPVWVGELYLELHRGTLTTQSRTKKLHREAEHRLFEAEVISSLAWAEGALEYPRAELEASWKRLLLAQFHDILPGSSIREVYQDANKELSDVLTAAQSVRDTGIRTMAGSGDDWWVVVNPSLQARPLRVMLPGAIGAAFDLNNSSVPSQPVDGGVFVSTNEITVPPLGMIGLGFNPNAFEQYDNPGVRVESDTGGAVLENEFLRVEIGDDGAIQRLFDKEHGREVVSKPANVIRAFHDVPREWEAWDVNPQAETEGEILPAPETIVFLESGPLRAALKAERRWRNSSITQIYRLSSGSRRLEIETHLDWHERRTLLRAFFPVNVRCDTATFETAFGAQTRPTHRNTPADAARFEVSGHRFIDLSEPGYGVSLLNDGRYAHAVLGNTISITLLRGSMYPDPESDLGTHRFTYALYSHAGDWVQANTTLEAFDLNSPLMVARVGMSSPREGFARVTGLKMMLSALKKADDDNALILRMYEPHGARGPVTLEVAGLRRAERVNLLEDSVEGNRTGNFAPKKARWLEVHDGRIRLEVRPFEVVTLKLYLN
jgi:alpha-mannosidase